MGALNNRVGIKREIDRSGETGRDNPHSLRLGTKVEANGSDEMKGVMNAKNEAAKLLQQFSGTPRFEKRRLHLQTV